MNHLERVYTIGELAEMWKVSDDTIRRLFRTEPGVRVVSSIIARRRKNQTFRIPESVAERVWNRIAR